MEMGTEDIALDLFGGCDFDMEMLCEESEDFTQSLYQQLANNSPSAHETSAQTSASDDPGRKFSDTSFVSALADGNPLQPMETSSIEDLKPVQPMMDTDENPEPIEKAEGSTVSKTNGKRRSSNVGRGSSAQQKVTQQKSTEDSAPLPPIVISPSDVDNISIQLEKNQQCACRDCGKLFNSVWYLKQHAVKHSNSRPFKCRFCLKTYKFRSNLYQHKCPNRAMAGPGVCGFGYAKRFYTRSARSSGSSCSGNGEKSGGGHSDIPQSECQQGDRQLQDSSHCRTIDMDLGDSHLSSAAAADGITGSFSTVSQGSHQEFMQQIEGSDRTILGSSSQFSSEIYSPVFGDGNSGNQQQGCIRERQLTESYIEDFIRENRAKVIMCRKCRCAFPNREYFSRHMTFHDEVEAAFACDKCPQRFDSQEGLKQHLLQHADDNSPHRCLACIGVFRSALALRRHKDICRQCSYPPFGIPMRLLLSATSPLDQFAFVDSDDEDMQLTDKTVKRKTTTDSGISSDMSSYSPTHAHSDTAEQCCFLKSCHKNDETVDGKSTAISTSDMSSTSSVSGHSPLETPTPLEPEK